MFSSKPSGWEKQEKVGHGQKLSASPRLSAQAGKPLQVSTRRPPFTALRLIAFCTN